MTINNLTFLNLEPKCHSKTVCMQFYQTDHSCVIFHIFITFFLNLRFKVDEFIILEILHLLIDIIKNILDLSKTKDDYVQH